MDQSIDSPESLNGDKTQLIAPSDTGSAQRSSSFTVVKTEPKSYAASALHHRASAVREEVASNVVLMEGIDQFSSSDEKVKQLVKPLIKSKMLPASAEQVLFEAKDSKCSMMRKVSDCADMLLHRSILPLLRPGLTPLYQTSLLWEDLDRNIEKLRAVLLTSDGPLTREFLLSARNAAKVAKADTQNDRGDPEPRTEISAVAKKGKHGEVTGSISTILLTPSRQDIANLRKDYVSGGEPPCLQIKAAKDATLVIASRASDLPTFGEKLRCWGFARFSRLYLLKPPTNPDLTQADVLAVCEQGKGNVACLQEWPKEADPHVVAATLLTKANGRRVHLFAKSETHGWESLVGDANWKCGKEGDV